MLVEIAPDGDDVGNDVSRNLGERGQTAAETGTRGVGLRPSCAT
jgi:hypothetical protein